MIEPADEARGGGPERFVAFTDAVVAIALTLLILPLLETISDVDGEESLRALVDGHVAQLGAFVLSFAVISQFWWAHHRMFEHVSRLSRRVVRFSQLWTFAIVFTPISTAITARYHPSPGTVGLYGGTLALTSATLTVLAWTIHRHPELSEGRTPATREVVLSNASTFVTMLLATLIGCAFADSVNYWAFLLMFLTAPVERLVQSRWRRA